jgi:hypothetical protein
MNYIVAEQDGPVHKNFLGLTIGNIMRFPILAAIASIPLEADALGDECSYLRMTRRIEFHPTKIRNLNTSQ